MWGGTALRMCLVLYPIETTGEAYYLGHKNGTVFVRMAAMRVSQLLSCGKKTQLFGNTDTNRPFPLLVKLPDAHQIYQCKCTLWMTRAGWNTPVNLVKRNRISWLPNRALNLLRVIRPKPAAAEFDAAVDAGDWDKLLRKVPARRWRLFYVPAGTPHALVPVLALETQQSSDVT